MPPIASTRAPKAKSRKPAPAVRALSTSQLPKAVQAMSLPSGTARFRAAKALMLTAGQSPSRVYPHFDALARMLQSESKVIRWNAMRALTSLAPIDHQHKLDGIVDHLAIFIAGHSLVTAVNAIQGLARIGMARPDLYHRIVPGLLAVEKARYRTAECQNVAIVHVLNALDQFDPQVSKQPMVRAFVLRQCRNPRPQAARMAQHLAEQWA